MKLFARVSPLRRFYLAIGTGYIYFLAAIAIPYLTYRQIPLSTALMLLSLYNIACSLLEYPTGVWGDVYGYKKSIFLGFVAALIGNLIFLLPGGIWVPVVALGFFALGVSLVSGSDYGLLNGLSHNQKKAIADYRFVADMAIFISAFVSGWLFKIGPYLPFIVSLGVNIVGAVMITTVPETRARVGHANVFRTAKQGFVAVRDSRLLLGLTILFTVIYGIALCVKYIFGSLTVLFDLKPEVLGMVIGLGAFIRAWGAKAYGKKDFAFGVVLVLLALALGMSGWWPGVYGIILGLLCYQLINGFFIAKIDHQFQQNCEDQVRASVFSFRKLSSRIFSSGYIMIFSLFLTRDTFGWIMAFSALGIMLTYLAVRALIKPKLTTIARS